MCRLLFQNELEQKEINTLVALTDYSHVIPGGKDGEQQNEWWEEE